MKKYKVRILLPSKRTASVVIETESYISAMEISIMLYGPNVLSTPEEIGTGNG